MIISIWNGVATAFDSKKSVDSKLAFEMQASTKRRIKSDLKRWRNTKIPELEKKRNSNQT